MNERKRFRRLIVAGAGPGDPELITLKALKAIQNADVILYDALVSNDLLKHAKPDCKLVFVGKRKRKKAFEQGEINRLIVFYATRYTNVLRLKGGDPYVFGRGHEELAYAAAHGIEAEVIPGLSSALAAPSAAGIPVTKRGINESFWVITGMLACGTFSPDLHLAAKSSATVVILMGMTHIEEILCLFSEHRSPQEPAAVIQHATLSNQKIIVGTANDLGQRVREQAIASPAVIIVGKVVSAQLQWPLSMLTHTTEVATSVSHFTDFPA